ncbi:MAG TPA: 23S rRNA (uracil(1939)-C(5))-methyltransferase RlmD [Balneolales bacterium]|nr:23S rRNA (uracil(1939)-C(5))-methyltransferase RlmD [Balneolales bacterium]
MSLKKGEELTLRIDSAAFKGKGVGRIDNIAIFVQNTTPGDLVKARIIKKKKKYREAKLLEVLEPGEKRIPPKCKHADICGGCSWQHIPYDYQLEIKRDQVTDHLQRIGGFKDLMPNPVIGSEQAFHYRNKMEYSFGDRRWLTEEEINSGKEIKDKDVAVGLHVPGRFDRILNLEECYLQIPVSYQIMDFVRSFALENDIPPYNTIKHTGFFRNVAIRNSYHTDDLMVNIVTYRDNESIMNDLKEKLLQSFPDITTIVNNVNDTKSPVATGRYEKIYYGPGFIRDSIGPYTFKIHSNAFFQTNTKQAEKLYDVALNFAAIQPDDLVYDLYCGVGTLTLYTSSKAYKVVGIEVNDVAIENARFNAKENEVSNVEFRLGDMKDVFKDELIAEFGKPDVIITDPPRSGMHPDVVEKLKDLRVSRLVYVSCNSSTMARDLAELAEIYDINEVQPVDMFPQTYHIENVVCLTLKK